MAWRLFEDGLEKGVSSAFQGKRNINPFNLDGLEQLWDLPSNLVFFREDNLSQCPEGHQELPVVRSNVFNVLHQPAGEIPLDFEPYHLRDGYTCAALLEIEAHRSCRG